MTIRTLTTLAVAFAACCAVAQEEAPSAAPAEDGGEAAKVKANVPKAAFTTLPFCQTVDGFAEVMLPGAKAWVSVEEGKFYPLGSSYRTRGADSKLTIAFGAESRVMIVGDASFGTRLQALGGGSRTVVIGSGELKLDLARNLPEGAFFVSAPGFTVKNLAGESKYVQTMKPDGAESVIRCVTGTLSVSGRHFEIPQMRAADEIRIRGTEDNLETFLYGTSGDYIVKLDRGVVTHAEVDDEGNMKPVSAKATLDWHLSPKTTVRINRLVPAIGERMSVAVMTFDAAGMLKNNFAYSEGRSEVNTGELVQEAKEEGDGNAAKKAAEAAEDTTTSAPAEEGADSDNSKTE